MTVPVEIPTVSHITDNVETVFNFTYKVIDGDDIDVYLNNSDVKEDPSTFTVVLNDPGGDVTMNVAPDVGTITLLRSTPQSQDTDYTAFGPFPAESHEDALDKSMMVLQESQEQLSRATVQPPGEVDVSTNPPIYDAGKGWMWSEGEPKEVVNSDDNLNGITGAAQASADASSASAGGSAASAVTSGAEADAAAASAILSQDQVALAADQVTLAEAQVALAADEVVLAADQVTLAEAQVALAADEVALAAAQVVLAEAEADAAAISAAAAAQSVIDAQAVVDSGKFFDFTVNFSGVVPASVSARAIMVRAASRPTGGIVAKGFCNVAPDASTVIQLEKRTAAGAENDIGTMTFSIGSNDGVYAEQNGTQSFAAGDQIIATIPSDANIIEDVTITMAMVIV